MKNIVQAIICSVWEELCDFAGFECEKAANRPRGTVQPASELDSQRPYKLLLSLDGPPKSFSTAHEQGTDFQKRFWLSAQVCAVCRCPYT